MLPHLAIWTMSRYRFPDIGPPPEFQAIHVGNHDSGAVGGSSKTFTSINLGNNPSPNRRIFCLIINERTNANPDGILSSMTVAGQEATIHLNDVGILGDTINNRWLGVAIVSVADSGTVTGTVSATWTEFTRRAMMVVYEVLNCPATPIATGISKKPSATGTDPVELLLDTVEGGAILACAGTGRGIGTETNGIWSGHSSIVYSINPTSPSQATFAEQLDPDVPDHLIAFTHPDHNRRFLAAVSLGPFVGS